MFSKPLLFVVFALGISWFSTAHAQQLRLANQQIVATFGRSGLTSIAATGATGNAHGVDDGWSMTIDSDVLRSTDATPTVQVGDGQMTYRYSIRGYEIEVLYRVLPKWGFLSKEILVRHTPKARYTVHEVGPLALGLKDQITGSRVPTSYTPQLGRTIEQTHEALRARDFGLFVRFGAEQREGLMLVVANPFLEVAHAERTASLRYAPEMAWDTAWGPFRSDAAYLAPYRLTGEALPREMRLEWVATDSEQHGDGLDRGEIRTFTDCVRALLLAPPTAPSRVEVGWTMNDYQIDVATEPGQREYRRIIDATAELGLTTLLFAPKNTSLALRRDDADAWHWEHTLWLNLGQKIRRGEWDPASSPIPEEVRAMIAYATSRHVGLLAYVYPSVPFAQDRSWLVHGAGAEDPRRMYASLGSRAFQDLLLRDLLAFKRRTGIAGYSFDYAFLDVAGSSSYAQWAGWRRVMEGLKRAEPEIILDGRQSYQLYGPWSWLAGTYPHPTGQDEQPESFKPYPDLHFDRVSADRTRYVNFWYRNYQFAPSEIVPGYATHQTERSRDIAGNAQTNGGPEQVEEVQTAFRVRDWDYLGYRYSFLSSIGTGGWNNVVDMIPARDDEESKHFSAEDKRWIRDWLNWTTTNKELLRQTRTILHEPGMGRVDGTSALSGDHGFLFLFNANYRALTDTIPLDARIGLTSGSSFLLREVYPQRGRLWGKPGAGVWSFGDTVPLALAGTSATVLQVLPASSADRAVIFNAGTEGEASSGAMLNGASLALTGVVGEPGTSVEVGVLLPDARSVQEVTINGQAGRFEQHGRYINMPLTFAGSRFAQAQQIPLARSADGSLSGTFAIPQRIFDQLRERARTWPIPWTSEDRKTTWLAPERLLLFLQAAEANDGMTAQVAIDGQPVAVTRAYTSVRVHPEAFVGLYADLSALKPEVAHSLRVTLSGVDPAKFQGAFFDNVVPQFTSEIRAARP